MPIPPKGTPERSEYFRRIGRLGGLATAAKRAAAKADDINFAIRASIRFIVARMAEQARSNVHRNGIPGDIADAISVGEIEERSGGFYVDLIVDTGDSNNVEDRRGRRAAHAYEFGSGEHGPNSSTYPITPKNASVLAFEWPGHAQEYPHSPKIAGYFGDEGFFFWYVDHPGVEKRPFLHPAVDQYKEALAKESARAFKEAFLGEVFQEVVVKI